MRQLLNTLYVTTEGSYLHLERDNVRVEVERELRLQLPLHHLGAVVCFGEVMMSPALMARCAEDGRSIAFLSRTGRFRCRVEGPTSGNVLLRRAQHRTLDDPGKVASLCRALVGGKIQNCRQSLLRGSRDAEQEADGLALREAAGDLARALHHLERSDDPDTIRGHEGEAAKRYFAVLDRMVRPEDRADFAMKGRTRRPPRDRMNATSG